MTANVWLVRSSEMDRQKFYNVFNLLNSIKGYFIFNKIEEEKKEGEEEHFKNQATLYPKKPWQHLFQIADDFRKAQNLGDKEYVVVLSDIGNTDNWFSGADYDGRKKNLFVHCDEWEYFSRGSDVRYPIAYHIAITLLHHTWFKSKVDLEAKVHKTSPSNPIPEGCINDFCKNKNQVHLKMRTGDICDACLQNLIDEEVDNNMIKHVLDIIGEISGLMRFSNKWKIDVKLPVLTIEGNKRNFQFKDLGNLKIGNTASLKHRVLYNYIYSKQYKGSPVNLTDFQYNEEIKKEFKTEYFAAYGLTPFDLTNPEYAEQSAAIDRACNPNETQSGIMQLVGTLKKAFINALGEDMAKKYYITKVPYNGTSCYIVGGDPNKLKLDYIKIE